MKPLGLKTVWLLIWVSIIVPGTVCPAAAERPLDVHVVNYPLKYFAERIGGNQVSVTLPVPKDVDPAYWKPNAAEIGAFQRADVILLNGAGYAKWLKYTSLPQLKIVNTSQAFRERYIAVRETVTHSHGPEGEHTHEGWAFTTWLDLSMAAGQAGAIADAFARIRPLKASYFKANFRSLEKDLLDLDRRIKTITAKSGKLPILFSHPVYDYFESAYGLNGKSVHWEPDLPPTPDQITELENILAAHPARWMIWEGVPNPSAVTALKVMNIATTVFAPCGNTPAKGDFLSVMNANVANLQRVFF
ncbi:MAG: adhesion lipoprotein [Proteobacteria bacterium]|nr:MAG: adhesion lipoprotein [Pseudomonadota bacterium]